MRDEDSDLRVQPDALQCSLAHSTLLFMCITAWGSFLAHGYNKLCPAKIELPAMMPTTHLC